MALLHDGNQNGKWREKIGLDAAKLRSIQFIRDIRLMIVIVCSHREIESDRNWSRYLAGIPLWSEPTSLYRSIMLEPSGSLVMKAFTV
jgi:hypothetical protein